jgi:type VI secretion system secreted protein VgrG
MTLVDEARSIGLTSPLGAALLVHRARIEERLGRVPAARLELRSHDHQVRIEDVLGQALTVHLDLPGGGRRHFDGVVTTFVYDGDSGGQAVYRAELRPWLWLLTLGSDCRIFQGRSVPEIVKQVFRDRGFTDFEERFLGGYAKRDYCVQFRESDFDFVSRLLEEEGIYYFFRHEAEQHTLVLCDGYASHEPVDGYEELRYVPPGAGGEEGREHVDSWRITKEVRPGACALTDFDFEHPRATMGARASIPREHGAADAELFDFPGGYGQEQGGELRAAVRLEALQARHEIVEGGTNARGLAVGGLFTLKDHPREDQEGEYLVVAADYTLTATELETVGALHEEPTFHADFRAMPSFTPFRSARTTPRPVVRGLQTALVVGPAGEEIWTDEYGRVKVQFHWDRRGNADEESSCWIRVAQSWAGAEAGALTVPRIGQEVLVDFLEGDPDRPVIVGQVYNAACRPPYHPDEHPTITTLKTLSSKGGRGFNELRIEDKAGAEQVFVHAARNLDLRVENDRFETVCRNRHLRVEQDKLEHVKHDRDEKVDCDQRESIGRDRNLIVGGKEAKDVHESLSLTVNGDVIESFRADHAEDTKGEVYLRAQDVVIEARHNITIKVGQSYVAIDNAGIKVATPGRLTLEAMGDLKASGLAASLESSTKTEVKGIATVSVNAAGLAEVRGGLVKIN